MRLRLGAMLLLAVLGAPAAAADITRHKSGPDVPILLGATVPAGAALTFLSGQVPPVIDKEAAPDSLLAYGDTKTQTIGVLNRIRVALETMGLKMGDIVKMTVFLVGDPALGGKMDFKGFSDGYAQFFGTASQPNVVARSTVQVGALVNPGWLVEIEVIAAK
jgi:enamine deaminase RidA (YjgF/YER057c/UK114 family)